MAQADTRRKKSSRAAASRAAPAAGVCPVSGLPHGAAAWAALAAAIEPCRTGGRPCVLALVDVDGFHRLSGELGLERAEGLLAELARRLQGALQGSEHVLGRLAGDQFAVALPDLEVEEALGRLDAVRREAAAQPFRLGRGVRRRDVEATISVGLAGLHRDAPTARELLVQANAALARAKALGGNRSGLADKDRMVLKTSYYPQAQLDGLKRLARRHGVKEAALLREALGDLFLKYKDRRPEA